LERLGEQLLSLWTYHQRLGPLSFYRVHTLSVMFSNALDWIQVLKMTKAPHAWIQVFKWRKPHTLVSHRVTLIQTKQQNECLVALGIRMILWEMVGLGRPPSSTPNPPTLDCSNTLCFLPFPSAREKEET
jgi:hypothetical protein